ncbi:MAG: hypothetical protein IJZ93_01650 [Clostridia bacterium]|nr:hypothetical protein [Clostridia bacterium]
MKKNAKFQHPGVVKELDSLGRLVIPKEMRTLFGFEKEVEVVVTEEGVLVRKHGYVLVQKDKVSE